MTDTGKGMSRRQFAKSAAALLLCGTSALGLGAMGRAATASTVARGRRPNIVLIVGDDLGYSDLGAFGGEISTPNLDALANGGAKLTNFHTAPQCSATRSMLMTGVDHHLVGFGASPEILDERQQGQPGYEGRLSDAAASFAALLKDGGYRTMMAGKWHLGFDAGSDPAMRGFERSFALLPGADNHFGQETEQTNGTTGPQLEYKYSENGEPVHRLPDDFGYSSDFYTRKLIEYLDELDDGQDGGQQPFFAYLAFSAPHYPLQAPEDSIARYRGTYDAGWPEIRRQRILRQRELGLMQPDERLHPAVPAATAWEDMDDDARAIEARTMEIYAAMIDRLDHNVGLLVRHLQESGRYDDTVFIFMSDNGAEGFAMEHSSRPEIAAFGQSILAAGDNRIESLGSADSYIWYGPGWGQVSTAPGWYYKHYITEGGTRVPAFVHGPKDLVRKGLNGAYATVLDLAPTFLSWAGIERADDGKLAFMGESMAATISGASTTVHGPDYGVGFEFWGRRAYYAGGWKAIHVPQPEGSGEWELYHVAEDRNETTNLAAQAPARLAELAARWDDYAQSVGVVMPARTGL